jgi:hypothetical protein
MEPSGLITIQIFALHATVLSVSPSWITVVDGWQSHGCSSPARNIAQYEFFLVLVVELSIVRHSLISSYRAIDIEPDF